MTKDEITHTCTNVLPAWVQLLECPVCGWLAGDGDEDHDCEQHEDAMEPVDP